MTKEDLDKRICDTTELANNTQTYREFIRESEKQFGMEELDIDSIDNKVLEEYIDFLDYLWDK